jgi:hypothetical protein
MDLDDSVDHNKRHVGDSHWIPTTPNNPDKLDQARDNRSNAQTDAGKPDDRNSDPISQLQGTLL